MKINIDSTSTEFELLQPYRMKLTTHIPNLQSTFSHLNVSLRHYYVKLDL